MCMHVALRSVSIYLHFKRGGGSKDGILCVKSVLDNLTFHLKIKFA